MDSWKKHTDKQLWDQSKKGNRQAFREIFDRHYSLLLGTGINMLKDPDAAKDVVQEVFLQIWKNRENLEIKSSLEAYLKRSTINRSLNRIRSKKNFIDENELKDTASSQSSAQELLEHDDLHAALQAGLNSLPERCRLIFVMKRMEGFSQKEIAEKLNISPKTVENQMTKALKSLKKRIAPFVKNQESS
ncbi:MAG: RNA polymerase sigma-70 factor [Bacteroidia bacterium]|nr:RNA polymerase sigma-70 factor [Bacteroidia bacterium]